MVASTDPGVVARDGAVPQHHQVREPASLSVRQLQREVDPRPRVRDLNLHLPLANGVGAVDYFRGSLLLIGGCMSESQHPLRVQSDAAVGKDEISAVACL